MTRQIIETYVTIRMLEGAVDNTLNNLKTNKTVFLISNDSNVIFEMEKINKSKLRTQNNHISRQ